MKLGPVCVLLLLAGCGSSTATPATTTTAPSTPTAAPEATTEPAAATAVPVAPAAAGAPTRTLFERLGGTPAITAVADELVNRTTTDPRIKYRFFNTDPVNLKRLLTEFVSAAAGGPVSYTGRDMATAHAGMDLVDDEFTALVEDLAGALDKFSVPDREKSELLGALGPLKPQMVVAPGKLHPMPEAPLARASALAATLKDQEAANLLSAAVLAGRRGQRSFAEQLFTRAEIIVGAAALASVAEPFREGAPPRSHSALHAMKDTSPQPAGAVGKSDDDEPRQRADGAALHGTLSLDGKSLGGLGLVMLWPINAKVAVHRTPKFRVVEQRNKTFAPHVMAVPVGSTVAFPNFDSIYHNVFSLSAPQRFDLGMYKSGDMRQVVFDKPGIIRLGCNIHANMSAYLIVVDAPHYVVSEGDGGFAFRNLRPGSYKVEVWSERSAEPLITELTVRPGDNETAFDLKGGAAQGPSEDKFGAARTP